MNNIEHTYADLVSYSLTEDSRFKVVENSLSEEIIIQGVSSYFHLYFLYDERSKDWVYRLNCASFKNPDDAFFRGCVGGGWDSYGYFKELDMVL